MGSLSTGRFDHSIPISGSGYPGFRSSGYSEKAYGLARYVSSTAGANKVINVCHRPLVFLAFDGTLTTPPFHRDWLFKMIVNPGNLHVTPAGECLQGIQLGAFDVATPYSVNYASDFTGGGCLQWRYNFTLSRFELLVWDADNGTAPEVVVSALNPTFSPDLNAKLMAIDYRYQAGDPIVRCYLNDVLAIEHQSSRLTNFADTTPTYGPGYFATSGSGATFDIAEAGFHENYYQVALYP